MQLHAGSGISVADATEQAVSDAVAQAKDRLQGATPTIAIVTATVGRDVGDVLTMVQAQLSPDVKILGITTCAAVLSPFTGPQPNGVGILLLSAADAFVSASCTGEGNAASLLKSSLPENRTLSGIIMFTVPGSEERVIAEIGHEFPQTPVYGGTAADNEISGSWRVMSSDCGASADGTALLGIVDGSGVNFSGCIVGPYTRASDDPSAEITSCEGRRIATLDGRPAADVLNEWYGEGVLGEKMKTGGMVLGETSTRPVGVLRGNTSNPYFVSIHIAGISQPDGAIDLFTGVSQGDRLFLLSQAGENAAASAEIGLIEAYRQSLEKGGISKPKAGLLIYCGGMSIAVGDELGNSLTGKFVESIDGDLQVVGMTCFGEQTYESGVGNVQRNLSVGMCLFG